MMMVWADPAGFAVDWEWRSLDGVDAFRVAFHISL